MPLAVRNIGKFVVGGQISVANVGFEQSEEDRRCFRAADIALRVHLSVRIADDVGEMVVAVELVRHAGRLPARIDRLVAVHRHACDLLRQRLVGIPAGKGIALAGRGLVERHLRAGRTALILVSCAAVRLIVQRIPGRVAGRAAAAAGAAEPVDIGHISGNAVRVGVRRLFPAAGGIFVSRRREHDLRYIACVQRAARGAVRLRIEHDRYGLVLCCAARPCAVDDAERDGGIFCPVCIQGFGAVHRVFKIRPIAVVGIPAEEGIAVSDRRTFRRNLISNFHIVHGLAAAPCAAVGVERHDRPPLGDEGQIGAHRHIQNIRIGIEKVIQIPVLEEIVGRLTGNRGRQAYAFLPQGRAVGNRICKNNGLFVRIQVSAFGPFIIRAKRYGTGIMCPFAVEVDSLTCAAVRSWFYGLIGVSPVRFIIPARERPALYLGNRFDRISRILGHYLRRREDGGIRVLRAHPVISYRAFALRREGIGIDIVSRLTDAVRVGVRADVPRAESLVFVFVDRSHTRRHVFRRQRSEAVAQLDGNGLVLCCAVRPFAVLHLEGHGLRAEPRPAAVKVGVCGQNLAVLLEFLLAVGILVPAVELEAVRRRRSRLIVTFSVSVKRKAQRGRRRDFIAVPVHRDDRAGPVKRDLNLGQPAAVQLKVAAERREHGSGVFDVGLSVVCPRWLSLVDRLVPQAVPAVEFQVQVVHGHCVLRRRGRLVRRSARGVLVFRRSKFRRRPAPDPFIVDADRVGDGDDDLLAVIRAPDCLACLLLRRNRQNVQRGLDGVAAADVRKALFGMAGGRRREQRRSAFVIAGEAVIIHRRNLADAAGGQDMVAVLQLAPAVALARALGESVHINAQLLGCALADIGVDFGHQLVERLVDVVHLTESLEIVRAVCGRIAADGRHGVVEVLPLLVGVVQRITAFQFQLVEITQTENSRAIGCLERVRRLDRRVRAQLLISAAVLVGERAGGDADDQISFLTVWLVLGDLGKPLRDGQTGVHARRTGVPRHHFIGVDDLLGVVDRQEHIVIAICTICICQIARRQLRQGRRFIVTIYLVPFRPAALRMKAGCGIIAGVQAGIIVRRRAGVERGIIAVAAAGVVDAAVARDRNAVLAAGGRLRHPIQQAVYGAQDFRALVAGTGRAVLRIHEF